MQKQAEIRTSLLHSFIIDNIYGLYYLWFYQVGWTRTARSSDKNASFTQHVRSLVATVAALWENVVDTDIIRLDTSRFDIGTSLAAVSADLLFLRLA